MIDMFPVLYGSKLVICTWAGKKMTFLILEMQMHKIISGKVNHICILIINLFKLINKYKDFITFLMVQNIYCQQKNQQPIFQE